MGCLADKLKDPALKVFYYTAGNSQIRIALTADMMKLQGAKIAPDDRLPDPAPEPGQRGTCA